MKFTRLLKMFVFIGLLFTLIACNNSQAQSVIYRLEDDGYVVKSVDFGDVKNTVILNEVKGAENVYAIYNRMDTLIAYLYEFENESEIEEMFNELDLDITDYDNLIYENLLVVPYENVDYISNILSIIKR